MWTRIRIHKTTFSTVGRYAVYVYFIMQVDMASLKARLGQVEAERAELAARLEDTGRRAEADRQRLNSTLCEEVSASQLQQVSATDI
jgi:hypothetical protein